MIVSVNGVFATQQGTPSNYLQVFPSSGLNILIKAGRGIFFNKWFLSDSDMTLSVDAAEPTLSRIDAVIVKVDKSENVRAASIYIKKGTPSSSPMPPEIVRTDYIHEYRLANITLAPSAVTITQANIEDTRGKEDCGWVTGLLQQLDTSTLYEQWQAGFDEWFQNVKETLSTATLISSFNSYYVTAEQDETTIPIQIEQYNQNLDILQVYINGLMLIKDVEYTVTDNEYVELTEGVDPLTPVSFVVYKSVDGSAAETVVSQVTELQNTVNTVRITSPTGAVKRSIFSGDLLSTFKSLGVGFHTMLASDAVTGTPTSGQYWRCFGHMTDLPYGWIVAISGQGKAYINFANGATSWTGWKELSNPSVESNPLWRVENGQFPTAATNITPSKPLSECEHGWTLVWSGYDDASKVARDVYVQTTQIPKKSYKNANWNGEPMTIPLVYSYVNETDVTNICQKTIYIYNDHISGGQTASTGKQRNLVLRAIYEY